MNLSSPSIAMALAAPLVLSLWIRSLADRKPSLALTLLVFALGGISIVPAGYLSSLLAAAEPGRFKDPYVAGLVQSFLEAALPEEAVRLVVVAVAKLFHLRAAMGRRRIVNSRAASAARRCPPSRS